MKKLIHDCDNTMGVPGCDVDDGLAILYNLGRPDIDLLGITTVFGNSDLETVYATTTAMMEEIGHGDVPVIRGAANASDRRSDAARFIVETVNSNPGDVSILATGPVTNLYAAYQLDDMLFTKVNEVVMMGGITEPLIIRGKQLEELNLSSDPAATECVMRKGRNVSVITGNACLDAFFPEADFRSRFAASSDPGARHITEKCGFWFERMMTEYRLGGFYNWDVVAAVKLAEPSLFVDIDRVFIPNISELRRGFLGGTGDGHASPCKVNTPRIAHIGRFTDEVYLRWLV